MSKKTMKQIILEHLEENGTITSWEAITNYGCTRIHEYIRQLRRENYNIKSVSKSVTTRFGRKTNIAVYTLMK